MSVSREIIRIGPLRIRRAKVKKAVYLFVALLIAFMFVSGMALMILTGQQF